MPEPPFDLQKAHRWFAVEFNNRAWDLVEAPSRSPAEITEMIDAAHATCLHWRAIGTPINQLRGECLIATAYAAAGMAQAAVDHAEKCLALSDQITDDQTDFDRASIHGAAANAYALAGDRARAQEQYRKLTECAAKLTDADDRQVLEKLYPER